MNSTRIRLKILGLLGVTTSVILLRDVCLVAILFAGLVLLCLIRGPRSLLRRVKPLAVIGVLVVSYHTLCIKNVPVEARFIIGVASAMRLMTLSLLVFLFTQTTSPATLLEGLTFLPSRLRLVVAISVSLIPILVAEAAEIRKAQLSRGVRAVWWNPIPAFLPMLIPLLHRTLRRAEHIAMVLQTRGFE